MNRLRLTAEAKRKLKIVPKSYKKPISIALKEIKDYPFVGKPLSRELIGHFSLRVGVYRIIYKFNRKDEVVLIMDVDHRPRAYN